MPQRTADIVGGSPGYCYAARAIAGGHHRPLQAKAICQFPSKILMDASRPADLDAHESFVPGALDVTGDGRRIETKLARDPTLRLAMDVEAGG
jgi:hypothetical protein